MPAPSGNPTRTGAHRPTVRWLISIFAATILLQRLSLPGGIIPVLLVVVIAACAYALLTGLMEFDRTRLSLYLLAAGLTAFAVVPQVLFIRDPLVSLTSWGLFMTIWAPATLALVHRSRETLIAAFRGCFWWGLALGIAAVLMRLIQMAGVPYVDPLAFVVPPNLLVQGYVITYPIEYGSEIYRSNAWVGLEPSIISLQLGVTLLLGLLLRMNVGWLAVVAAGIVCTVSGSGVFIALIGVAVMLFTPMRRSLWGYVIAGSVALVLLLQTPAGQSLGRRATEITLSGSSTSLRAIEPYRYLWPQWTADPHNVLFGLGAGSSQKLVDATNRAGLLIPSPVKVFFDYGVVAGIALAIFLVYCYYGAPSLSLAVSLFTSAWILQPGTTTFVLVAPTLIFVTWWAPRAAERIEVEPVTRLEATRPKVEVHL